MQAMCELPKILWVLRKTLIILLFPFYTALKGEISRNIIIIKDQNFYQFMTRKVDNRYMFFMR